MKTTIQELESRPVAVETAINLRKTLVIDENSPRDLIASEDYDNLAMQNRYEEDIDGEKITIKVNIEENPDKTPTSDKFLTNLDGENSSPVLEPLLNDETTGV